MKEFVFYTFFVLDIFCKLTMIPFINAINNNNTLDGITLKIITSFNAFSLLIYLLESEILLVGPKVSVS